MRTTHSWARAVTSVAVLGLAGLGLSACGSSSSTSGGATAAATTSTSTGATPTAGSTPSTASTVTTAATVPSLGGGSFCDLARDQKTLTDQQAATASLATDTPAQLQAYFKTALDEIQSVIHKAPSAIQPALTVVLQAEQALDSDLQAVGYNFTKVTASTFSNLNETALGSAGVTISEYLAAHCGIPYTPAATTLN